MRLIVKTVLSPKLKYNVYAVKTRSGTYLFDCGPPDSSPELITALQGEHVRRIFLTHGHADHAGAGKFWLNAGVEVLASKAECELLRCGGPAGVPRIFHYPAFEPVIVIDEPMSFSLDGDFNFTVVPAPGHTPGSVCYYESQKNLLISGDLLFGPIKGYAVTILTQMLTAQRQPRSDIQRQIASLKHLADTGMLSSSTLILPGHGPAFRFKEKPDCIKRSARLLRMCAGL